MSRIVVIGGGWAGCSAAITARQLGADVVLLERMDMLLGTGLSGGVMRNNGRWTATEEAIAMGGGAIWKVIDETCKFKNIEFTGSGNASLYNLANASLYNLDEIEPRVKKMMIDMGIRIQLECRVRDVVLRGSRIEAVVVDRREQEPVQGDVFVETTGTAGPANICEAYGNGCATCILRCFTFGGRVSVALKAGVKEMSALSKKESLGAMSGACLVAKGSLTRDLVSRLEAKGAVAVPIPDELRMEAEGQSAMKACPQFEGKGIPVLETGYAKLLVPFFPLESLRKISGFEKARYADPLGGGRGNSIRFASISPRENTLKVKGLDNLFCGGEKTGPVPGHTEAILTGMLAGYNAVRESKGKELITLPKESLLGDFISYVGEQLDSGEGLKKRYTFSGSIYFSRMKEMGFYTLDKTEIEKRVKKAGLQNIFLKA